MYVSALLNENSRKYRPFYREGKLYPRHWTIQILINHSCTPGNTGKTLSAYFYYLTAMLYDLIMLAISTTYLLRYHPLSDRCIIFRPYIVFRIAKSLLD